MASYNLAPIGNDAPFFISTGVAASGYKLFTYTAGSTTKQNTYQDNAGNSANANPILLNSSGYPASGGSVVEIWLTAGVNYKFVLAPSTDTDPPASPVWTRDNLVGINDVTSTLSEWVAGPAPTFISATSFSLVGDQTANFTVGRRLKTTNTAGTIYSTITVSAFTSLTTVTVVNDSGTLDSGLSAVSYGILQATNVSTPQFGKVVYLSSVAGTNTITSSANLAATGLKAGQFFSFIPANTITGAVTLNINSLGAKNVFANGFACIGGELVANVPVVLIYDGTQFNILGNTASTGTHATTFTWNGSGATSGSKNLAWRKNGSFVTMNIPQTNPITGTGSTTLTGDTALPAVIRPAAIQILPCNTVLNNAAAVAEPGIIQINTSGVITFNRNYALAAFTNSAAAGIDQAITFTYCLV